MAELLTKTSRINKKTYPWPRLPHEVLLAVGGWSGGSRRSGIPTNTVEAYDIRVEKCQILSRLLSDVK